MEEREAVIGSELPKAVPVRQALIEEIVEAARDLVSEGAVDPSDRYVRLAQAVYALDDADD